MMARIFWRVMQVVGLFVGAVIVVQILTSDVQDHLGEYATFKAMGVN